MARKSRKQKYLSMLVALTLMAGGVAEASERQIISYDGYPCFDITIFDLADYPNFDLDDVYGYNAGQSIFDTINGDTKWRALSYTFTEDMKNWIKDGADRWAEILRPGLENIKSPGQIILGSCNERGAFSSGLYATNGTTSFKDIMQGRRELPYIDFNGEFFINGFSTVAVGQGIGIDAGDGNYGWSGGVIGQLPQQYGSVNLTNTIFHELAHSLGVFCNRARINYVDSQGKSHTVYTFEKTPSDSLDFTSHLLDEKGNRSRPNQLIVNPLDSEYSDADRQTFNDNPEKYFQLSKVDKLLPNNSKGRGFFTGTNVLEVLEGRDFCGINGIPIKGWEGNSPELSHIELERSLMSHQSYRSYNTFMEAELALMQDIGYNIDRKNFYGKSLYKNDEKNFVNTQGFFARNDEGTDYIKGEPNTATMGVGLHIYGSRNNVTQTSNGANDRSADLLACGAGAAGIRIDGVENNVTLASDANIEANGTNGVGVLAAYGRDHQITVDGNVYALGDGGDAIRFDFGGGFSQTEYRGSYIRYEMWTKAAENSLEYITNLEDIRQIADAGNWPLLGSASVNGSYSDPVNGDLGSKMGSLTVSGSLAGKSHAIYIANNAFVDNINIEKGAKISGDITSDWKHFDEKLFGYKQGISDSKLQIQYGANDFDYDEYCSDLVTNLNINGDFAYDGNITGADNMKLKVNNGATLAYTGTADVVGVQVAKGASLYGGNYKVNEIKKYASFESVDNEAGKVINHGTIGALTNADNMVIDGNLESDGVLLRRNGGAEGRILVSGKTELLAGSGVAADGGLPGESFNVLQSAGGITGAENVQRNQVGLLNYIPALSADGKNLMATAQGKESLDGATPQQAEGYANLVNKAPDLAKNLGAEKELRSFFALDSDAKGLQAIDEIGTNDKEDAVTAVLSAQSSTVHNKVLSSRLATALGQSPAMLHIGSNHLAEGDDSGMDVPVKLSTEQDKSAWVKFSRNWSRTAGGSNYTGSTITMGYDWKHGANQRNGFFGSYTDSGYGHYDGSEKLQDTRFGYYTGIHKGANTQLFYADFGYLKGNRSRNVVLETLGTANLVKGDYTGWLAEIGGEWKHDLHEIGAKTWQVSPYGAFQMSYMKQHGYSESGSLKAYDISGGNNFYAAIEGGFEFSRYMPKGSFNFRLGLRHALTGTGYEAYENSVLGRSYTKSSRMDKTHLVTSMAVETEFAPRWTLGAELSFQKGAHDRDIMASLQIRRMW